MSKTDVANKLEQREVRRKQSVVKAMISNEPIEPVEGQISVDDGEPLETKLKKESKRKGRPKANRETKKRITFTVYQSQYEQASKIAYVDGKSVSEVIGDFLTDYIKKNASKIAEYDSMAKEE